MDGCGDGGPMPGGEKDELWVGQGVDGRREKGMRSERWMVWGQGT
jgi:hypothetical protein